MGVLLEVVEWLIIIGAGALVGAIAGVIVVSQVSVPLEDARVLLLALFTVAGMFTSGSIFAMASGE